MRQTDARTAKRSKTTHAFYPGRGYFQYDKPPAQVSGENIPPIIPAPGSADGSRHILCHGTKELDFAWVAAERAWERHGGARMAFTGAYLAAHGWRYVRVAGESERMK